MKDFSKKAIASRDIPASDNGVNVKSVIELVESNPYYEELAKLLEVDKIMEDFIDIPGASTIVNAVKSQNKKYKKFDLISNFNDLEFKEGADKSFTIKFNSIPDDIQRDFVDKENFTAELVYSSKSDFFESTFGMDKYASTLTNKGYSELVYQNLELIRAIYSKGESHKKVYRILKDTEGNFYLRAIVSDQYNDYNNNITVFLGLVTLYQEMQKSDVKFAIDRCEYNESFIRIFFEKIGDRLVENVGRIKYLIELSNDEIKRESLRFSGVSSIIYGDNANGEDELYIKPKDLRSNISAIRHNLTPKKAIEALTTLADYVKMEQEMFDDIQNISKIQSPDQIRYLLQTKIERTRQAELKKYSDTISEELKRRVNTIYDLLALLKKIDLIVADIDAKEYLRFLMYEILIESKTKPNDRA